MTKQEIEAARAESNRYRELVREAGQRHQAFLSSGEEGNEAQEPQGGVDASTVTTTIDGQPFKVEVFDATFGDCMQRFTNRVEAIRWVGVQRKAWRVANLGNVERRKLRSRLKAEIQRVGELERFADYLTNDQRRFVGEAVANLARTFLAIAVDGSPQTGQPAGDYATEKAKAVIEGEAAAVKTASRTAARKKRAAKKASRGLGGRGDK